jgi:Fic family protein
MARIVKRHVKGKLYYYLEESVKQGANWRKESVYLGAAVPDEGRLRAIFGQFEARMAKKGVRSITPPCTQFITRTAARRLEKATEQKKDYVHSLSESQRTKFTKHERIIFITDSNAIEGSTLDYGLTERVVSDQKRIENFQKRGVIVTGMGREEQEALNLNKCLDIYGKMLAARVEIGEEMILRLHHTLLAKIEGYSQYQGIWRPVNVMIRGSDHVFPHHRQVPDLMRELLEWYAKNRGLIHPAELAAKFHTRFTSVHPFADGNGRMARLLMNYILQTNGFPFTNIPLKRRSTYMKTQAAGNHQDLKPFTLFLSEEIVKQCQRLKKK